MRAQPDEMRSDARHFSEQDANVLRALGNFDSENFFDRKAIAEIIGKRREVIDPVRHRDGLRIGFRFHVFLDAGVQIADHRARFQHDFAVQLENHAQHAVRRRVLRSHVQDHRVG